MSTPDRSVTFDHAATFYDQTRGFPPGVDLDAAALMARVAGLTRTSVVIEIGVGTGRIALPLAPHCGVYIGIDLSAAMLDVLRSKQPRYPGGDIRVACGDVMRLPVATASADVAVLAHILHLIPDPHGAVDELARVLRPDGAAIAVWDRRQEAGLRALTDAWDNVTGDAKRFEDADAGPQTLSAAGWTLRAQDTLTYTTWTTAHDKADVYRKRIYSSMWRLPDETWRAGVEAVEAALAAHYPDPHAPQRVEHSFYVAVYDRP